MLRACDIDALSRLKRAALEKVAANPALVPLLLGGVGGAALGAGLGAHLMHAHDESALTRSKNTAFGAGIAAGLAGPTIVNRLHTRLNPTSQPNQSTETI